MKVGDIFWTAFYMGGTDKATISKNKITHVYPQSGPMCVRHVVWGEHGRKDWGNYEYVKFINADEPVFPTLQEARLHMQKLHDERIKKLSEEVKRLRNDYHELLGVEIIITEAA